VLATFGDPRQERAMKIVLNGEEREAPEGLTLAQLLRQWSFDPHRVAVEVNLKIVPRADQERFVVHGGDRLEVVTFVGGG
jgi:sulfur carrier protein